ncbi:MAG TPA: four-carbon acid sugar kinase family protein [Chloroflexota bacterium]
MSETRRLLILADDFSGACDAAGPFGVSRPTRVVAEAPAEWPSGVEVLAIDLGVRECADGQARQRLDPLVRHLSALASRARVFVKIDSTLRGPIGTLVAEGLDVSRKDVAVIAPAFPEQGRLLHAGHLVLHGRRGANLVDIVGAQGTALLAATAARSTTELERAIEQARAQGARRVLVDADHAAGLARLGDVWRRHPEWLLVGSAGLARHLSPRGQIVRIELDQSQGPLLVVAGSPAAATREQLGRLESVAAEHVVVILRTPPALERDAGQAAALLAAAVERWASSRRPRALFVTGGTTARVVCERLGARALCMLGELAPGVPLAVLEGGVWDGLPVVTKAGGFGTPETLLDVARALGVSSA